MQVLDAVNTHTDLRGDSWESKLRNAIAYITLRGEGDESFGHTKLAKTLFYADFLHYLRYGKPITGVPYYRYPNGPLPKLMYDALKSGPFAEAERHYFGYSQKVPLLLSDAGVVEAFSGSEIAVLDEVIDELRGQSAREISALSHGIAWHSVAEGEPIPYEAAHYSPRRPGPEDAAQLAELLAAGAL